MNGSGSGTTRRKSAGWFSCNPWMNPVVNNPKKTKNITSLSYNEMYNLLVKIAIVVSTYGIFCFTICGYTKREPFMCDMCSW